MKIRVMSCVMLFLLGTCGSLMAADWGILMIDLGKKDVSQGILMLEGADGVTEPDTIGGKEARVIPKVPPALPGMGNHIYFIVDGTIIDGKSKEDKLWIAIEYFDKVDGGATGILMDYDDKGDTYPQQAFALNLPQGTRTINFTDTNEWKIAIIYIDQAEFKEQGNGGDFRFHIVPYMSGKFYVDRVWISNKEFKETDLTGKPQAVSLSGKLAISWGRIKQER